MPSLTRTPKKVDATGQPLAPTKLYVPIIPYAHDHKVYGDRVELLGSDPAVVAVPTRWIRTDAGSAAKGAALRAHRARGMASLSPAPPDPTRTRILGLIPPERRVRAVKAYHDRAGRIIGVGDLYDADDEFVRANRHLFEAEQDSAA